MVGRPVGRSVGDPVGSPVGGEGGSPTPPVETGIVGSQATDGAGNWGFAPNRAMGNSFQLLHDATLKIGQLYIIPESGSGSAPVKMAVYTDIEGAAGNLLAVSLPTTVSSSGWHDFVFEDDFVPAQGIHIIAVAGPVDGIGWDMGSFNSGGLPAARIYNDNGLDYDAPPAVAPAPNTAYNNGLAVNIQYEYTP